MDSAKAWFPDRFHGYGNAGRIPAPQSGALCLPRGSRAADHLAAALESLLIAFLPPPTVTSKTLQTSVASCLWSSSIATGTS